MTKQELRIERMIELALRRGDYQRVEELEEELAAVMTIRPAKREKEAI